MVGGPLDQVGPDRGRRGALGHGASCGTDTDGVDAVEYFRCAGEERSGVPGSDTELARSTA